MNRYRTVSTIALLSAIAACSGAMNLRLTASPEIPAAQSTAKITSTDNGNTKIDLKVEHLAAPGRVNSTASVYVVWVRADHPDARPQNIGALRVDGDLNGEFIGVTPLKSFDLFVTAESSQAASQPTGNRLLYTSVSRK